MKDDLKTYRDAWSLLDQLTVYAYTWNDKAPQELVGQKDVGLLAQELEQVYAQAVVHGNSPDEFLRVRYSKLVPVLISALRDLRDRVNSLECRCK